MCFQLAFEADIGFAFPTLDIYGLRFWSTDPFLTFLFRANYHERIFLIFDVIFELSIALDNFRTIPKDSLELSGLRGLPAFRYWASEIVNLFLIDINFQGLLDASCAVNVSALLKGVAAILIQVIQAYLALGLLYSDFSE